MGNPLKAIGTAVPARLAEAREERQKLVARVLDLCYEIAQLETIAMVGGEAAGPVVQALKIEPSAEPGRRRAPRTGDAPLVPPVTSDAPQS